MTAPDAPNTTDNHFLELVGGEWDFSEDGLSGIREIRYFVLRIYPVGDDVGWSVTRLAGDRTRTFDYGEAPTREAAIDAAEASLLEEIGKFVRVKQ